MITRVSPNKTTQQNMLRQCAFARQWQQATRNFFAQVAKLKQSAVAIQTYQSTRVRARALTATSVINFPDKVHCSSEEHAPKTYSICASQYSHSLTDERYLYYMQVSAR